MFLLPGNQSIVKVVAYTENYDDTYKADVTFKRFIYPRGRCMIVSPPINRTLSDKTPNRLTVAFRDSFVDQLKLSSAKLKVYLMDKANSPLQYPDEMEMDGNQIEVPLQSRYYVYRTKISKSEHVLGEPLFDCAVYTVNNSFDDCIKKEKNHLFEKELGCQPPPLAEDDNKMCNRRFHFSKNRSRLITGMFFGVATQDGTSRCKVPCTKSRYSTRYSFDTPSAVPGTHLSLVFDQQISIVRSSFSMSDQTFLTQSGGFIGVGRTLLWIMVSLLGARQVKIIRILILW